MHPGVGCVEADVSDPIVFFERVHTGGRQLPQVKLVSFPVLLVPVLLVACVL